MFTECSLNVHRMFTECSLNVHRMFTDAGTLYVGIAADELLAKKANAHLIQSYETRAGAVVQYLKAVRPDLEVQL